MWNFDSTNRESVSPGRMRFRAAVWVNPTDSTALIRLTLPEHADLPDADLIAEAQREADSIGLEIHHIKIDQWCD